MRRPSVPKERTKVKIGKVKRERGEREEEKRDDDELVVQGGIEKKKKKPCTFRLFFAFAGFLSTVFF